MIGAALAQATIVATLALAGVAVHVEGAAAECSGLLPVPRPIRTYVGHAFTATVAGGPWSIFSTRWRVRD